MSTEHDPSHNEKPEPKVAGVVAEYDSPDKMLAAANALREAGFKRFDVHTPFPVHGTDEAVGIRPTILPWIVLCFALFGAANALGMIYLLNKVFYPFQISGKPLFALPPAMPITFELTVLFSAISAFVSVFVLSKLPRFNNPLLRSTTFARSSDDRFVVAVDAADPQYSDQVEGKLGEFGPITTEEVLDDGVKAPLPRSFKLFVVILAIFAAFPPTLAALKRSTTTTETRIHPIQDMDAQVRANAQQPFSTAIFADGKAARPQVPGTIARGDYVTDIALATGIEPVNGELPPRPTGKDAEGNPLEPGWVTAFPIEVTDKAMARGKERYEIFCVPCHGLGGDGNGLVTQRAIALGTGHYWVPPVSFHSAGVRSQPVGRIFDTITNGRRKMAGYADQISPDDRWAIALYVRALQRSRVATPQDLDPETFQRLRSIQ